MFLMSTEAAQPAWRAHPPGGTLLLLLVILVVWAPLPLGSNRPVFWPVNGLLVVLIVSLFLLGEGKQALKPDSRFLALPLAGLTLAVVWMLAQAVPLSLSLGALSHPLRLRFEQGIPGAYDAVSVNPSVSLATVAQFAPPVVLAAIAAVIGRRSRENAMLLVNVVAFSAAALALYGTVALFFGFDQVPLNDSDDYAGSLTATFVSRDAAAAYLAIGLACAAAILADRMAGPPSDRSPPALIDFLISFYVKNGIHIATAVVLFSGLLQTASRAGVTSGLAGLLVVVLVSWRRITSGRQVFAALIVLAPLLIVISAVSSTFLRFRLHTVDPATDPRFPIYRDTLRMIAERPFLGHGAGAFADVYPLFQSATVPPFLVWNRAHSTYLQVAVELGLPIFAALILVAAVCIWRIVRCAADRRAAGPAVTAALGAVTVAALHSLVDFSLQIQAVGIVFAVVSGLGYGEASRVLSRSDSPPAERTPIGSSEPRSPIGSRLFCALLVSGIVIIAFAETRLALVVGATPRQLWLEEIPQLVPSEASVDQGTASRANAVSRLIRDPALVTGRLAPCVAERAAARAQSDGPRFYRATMACLSVVDDALAANPLSGELWLERSNLLFGQPGLEADFGTSLRRAFATSPRVGWLAARRVVVGIQAYWSLAEDLRGLVRQDLDLVLATPSLAGPLVTAVAGDELFRQLTVSVVGTLKPESQEAFLGLLEQQTELDLSPQR